ncbi:hypothetical protein CMI37_01410 [Candidatus Pacearchaeota archaeon]|nr:hypothetical protein [Candidatus Pacearchaeota archaeon]
MALFVVLYSGKNSNNIMKENMMPEESFIGHIIVLLFIFITCYLYYITQEKYNVIWAYIVMLVFCIIFWCVLGWAIF